MELWERELRQYSKAPRMTWSVWVQGKRLLFGLTKNNAEKMATRLRQRYTAVDIRGGD